MLNALSAFGSTISVIFYDNRFGALDDKTGAYTAISTLPLSASSGIAAMNGLLYVENMGSTLFSVDPFTGVSQQIGATGLTTTSGAFAGGANGLFEVDYLSDLYSINPTTGRGQLVGATGLAANNGGFDTSLSSDGNSLYYTAGRAGALDELFRINVATGLATDLGSTGVTGIAGSAFVGSNLELFQYGQGTNYIYSASVGLTDFVREAHLGAQIIDGGAVFSLPAAASLQSTASPEPGSALLLAAGLLFPAVILGRHRSMGPNGWFLPMPDPKIRRQCNLDVLRRAKVKNYTSGASSAVNADICCPGECTDNSSSCSAPRCDSAASQEYLD